MRVIETSRTVEIPKDVKISVHARTVTVIGPRGKLTRKFNHAVLNIYLEKKNLLKITKWFGKKKFAASVGTVAAHVRNMIIGVTKGFLYKMRLVYAHFPINCIISENKKSIEIRNFLGEKHIRKVDMFRGVTVTSSTAVKDELLIQGNDIEMVSKSAAAIHTSCKVVKKDIRKFLDGIYVSEKTTIVRDEE
ncbi:unnamed protein product [Bemisia tabaci]|uniref:Large ribosomal subunit protein uL6 n=2 Tax=Bemisia tabaci TaxID=7038 RepID=A0A9P0ALN9_BEMTA|nr:PREDICTED: 60S ribosomal protein L9 [Bemisia tabaci]XP_018914469.1 PREDICTED: 60S ribosomal protein L9 [Bemisia tabaci]CAH0393384.1 unnamed protein product [Bemisia tabaci]